MTKAAPEAANDGDLTWPDKSGSMRYRPTRQQVEQDRLILSTRAIYQTLYELDLLIEKYAYALEILQPSIDGKIAVRYLQHRGITSDSRHPTFIQWKQTKNGKLLYERIQSNEVILRIPRSTVFNLIRDIMKDLLQTQRGLIEKRQGTLDLIANFRRTVGIQTALHNKNIQSHNAVIDEKLKSILRERNANLDEYVQTLREVEEIIDKNAHIEPEKRPRADLYGNINATSKKA